LPRQLHFNLHLSPGGHHLGSWRRGRYDASRHDDIQIDIELVRLAERGKFDSVFIPDAPMLMHDAKYRVPYNEPLMELSALASATSHIGLIATVSTTYFEPFNLARQMASLDRISRGRAGWNIVTTAFTAAGRNFGDKVLPDHDGRYRDAEEFVEIVLGLWDGWEEDAIVADAEAGVFVDTDKVHAINHEGNKFSVAGPLNVPPSPQRRPVLVQAGHSEVGRDFGARYGEVIFTNQQSLGAAQAFYADMKSRAERFGRSPDEMIILPGVKLLLASTEAEAKERSAELFELIDPEVGLATLRWWLDGIELDLPLGDEPFPDLTETLPVDLRDRFASVLNIARSGNLTTRQLLKRLAAGTQREFVGTPEQFADDVEQWFGAHGVDGFTIQPQEEPGGLEIFVDHVVPILQQRGLFREEYEGTTLRDSLGLPPVPSRRARASV
jgi:N-acetyl-S-(2-succino)cysteine monooxygenase